jgi:hypothetical protein
MAAVIQFPSARQRRRMGFRSARRRKAGKLLTFEIRLPKDIRESAAQLPPVPAHDDSSYDAALARAMHSAHRLLVRLHKDSVADVTLEKNAR